MLKPESKSAVAGRMPAFAELDGWARFQVEQVTGQTDLERELGQHGFSVREYLEGPRGEEILKAWIAENPGTRPAWWYHMHCGELGAWKVIGELPASKREPCEPFERRESEAAFLYRQGLLTPAEVKLWGAGKLDSEELSFPAYAARGGLGLVRRDRQECGEWPAQWLRVQATP